MFRRQFLTLKTFKHIPSLRTNTTQAQKADLKWDILCSVCLERKPIISRPMRKIEKEFMQMLKELEEEKSMKSEHELRHEADQRRAEEFKKGKVSVEDMDTAIGETAAEFEDKSAKEFAQFKPASRITEADEKNDLKSTDRKLDKSLVFIIKEKIGMIEQWGLPQSTLQEEESLRQAAERIVRENYGRRVKAKFFGNAPYGFYKYKYPKPVKENSGSVGAKIFFMKAQYLGGNIEENERRTDYCWASRDELSDRLVDRYHKAVSLFLIDDEEVE